MKTFLVLLLFATVSICSAQGVKGTVFKHRTADTTKTDSLYCTALTSTPITFTILRAATTTSDTLYVYYNNDTTNAKGVLIPAVQWFTTPLPVYGVKWIRVKPKLGSYEYFFWSW